MKIQKDCYYFADSNNIITPMCTKCYVHKDKNYGNGIWFWPGSQEGYGPFDIKCSICGEAIYTKE